jgi:hypothetical protein
VSDPTKRTRVLLEVLAWLVFLVLAGCLRGVAEFINAWQFRDNFRFTDYLISLSERLLLGALCLIVFITLIEKASKKTAE